MKRIAIIALALAGCEREPETKTFYYTGPAPTKVERVERGLHPHKFIVPEQGGPMNTMEWMPPFSLKASYQLDKGDNLAYWGVTHWQAPFVRNPGDKYREWLPIPAECMTSERTYNVECFDDYHRKQP